jgi:hypothetical protein
MTEQKRKGREMTLRFNCFGTNYTGYAFVEPPAELRACFDEIERCGAVLRRHRPELHEMHFKKKYTPESVNLGNSPAARHSDFSKRTQRSSSQRSCAVLAAINAAWSKATNCNKAFDVSVCATPCELECMLSQLKELFEWIEEQDLMQHPNSQALANHVMQIESSQRECRELLAKAQDPSQHQPQPATDEAKDLALTHTEVRCLETRMQLCGRHSCVMLDTICR